MDYKVVLNNDKDKVLSIRSSLKENEGYCPCRIDKTDESKCMCKEFRESTSSGYCHCGLYCKIPKINYLSVDFDGTIVEHKFPVIGNPNLALISKLRLFHEYGVKIILYTCREDGEVDSNGVCHNYLTEAVNWCRDNNVPIDAVNHNPWVSFGVRKIYSDIYIDDRAVNVSDIERI